jgi:hypothetical protein
MALMSGSGEVCLSVECSYPPSFDGRTTMLAFTIRELMVAFGIIVVFVIAFLQCRPLY